MQGRILCRCLLSLTLVCVGEAVLADSNQAVNGISEMRKPLAEKIPLKQFLGQVREQTGYQIILLGDLDAPTVTAWSGTESPNAAVDYLIRQLGSPNHIVFIDHAAKVIRVAFLQEVSVMVPMVDSVKKNNVERASKPSSEPHSPVSNPADLPPEELARIKADYRDMLAKQTPDTIISAPSEYGEGATIGQVELAKQTYQAEKDLHDEGAMISPGGEEGSGITQLELDNITEAYYGRVHEANVPLSPGSGLGDGVTTKQLEEAVAAYRERLHVPN